MPDQSCRPAPEFQTNLGQLRGFARTGFTANNRYLIFGNGFFDFVEFFVNGQRVVKLGFGQCGQTLQKDFVRFSVFFFDFGQTAVFVGIFEGGLQEVAVFGEGLGMKSGNMIGACAVKNRIIANALVGFGRSIGMGKCRLKTAFCRSDGIVAEVSSGGGTVFESRRFALRSVPAV